MKKEILNKFIEFLSEEKKSLEISINTAKVLAHSDEYKAESKYDTRSTEAGYLLVGQQRRLAEIQNNIAILNEISKNLEKVSIDSISVGNIVTTNKQDYFLLPLGNTKEFDGVKIISVDSPLGKKFLGLAENDFFEFKDFEFEIIKIK